VFSARLFRIQSYAHFGEERFDTRSVGDSEFSERLPNFFVDGHSRSRRGGLRTKLVQITIHAMGYDLRLRRSLCGKAAML
jgi:hypothetical protein